MASTCDCPLFVCISDNRSITNSNKWWRLPFHFRTFELRLLADRVEDLARNYKFLPFYYRYQLQDVYFSRCVLWIRAWLGSGTGQNQRKQKKCGELEALAFLVHLCYREPVKRRHTAALLR